MFENRKEKALIYIFKIWQNAAAYETCCGNERKRAAISGADDVFPLTTHSQYSESSTHAQA